MMFRRLFGGGSDKKEPERKPEHVWDLRPGDFLKLALVAPEGLSGAELQVASVHAADFGGPHKVRRVLALEGGDGGPYTLWRDESDKVALGLEIQRPVVEQLFDLDEFARLFDPDEPPNLTLQRQAELPQLAGWTAPVYRQEAAHQAYLQRQDPAVTAVDSTLTDDAEEFDHYRLVGDRRRFAVEVAVFDGGRTEVTLVALLPEAVIEEIWAA